MPCGRVPDRQTGQVPQVTLDELIPIITTEPPAAACESDHRSWPGDFGDRGYDHVVLPTGHLVAFALTAFALIVVPGPSVLFVISRSLVLGARAGVATVIGNASGGFLQVLAVAFGLGPLVQRSIAVFTIVKLVGAGYLVYLGVQAIHHRRAMADALGAPVEAKATRRILRDAFVVGATNPKTIIVFTAVLPQFVDRSAGNAPVQLLLLGVVFYVIALISDSTWALVAGGARSWLVRSPRRLEVIGGTGGLVMIGIGARLALTGRKD